METITTTIEYTEANDADHLTAWLEKEYPHGIDLYYIDYRDSLDESPGTIMELVRDGYSETLGESFMDYDISYTMDEIEKNYLATLDDVDDMSDELRDVLRDWVYEHDTSNPQKDLLRNTSAQLFYIDTGVEAYENRENIAELVRRFGGNDEKRIAAIKWITNEQMYHSTISFYFHADTADIINALHKSENAPYITIDGAMIANVTRGNGSNWVHDDNVFKLVIPRAAFIENVYMDKEPGTGYGWYSICGDWNRDEAGISTSQTKTIKGYKYIEGETSMDAIRERELAKHWHDTKTCTRGDMNYNRHVGPKEYSNDYPCGTTCKACGTFWID